MAVYRVGGNSVFRVDATAGGTLVAMTAYISTISGLGKEFDQRDATALSDTAERVVPGIERGQEFSIQGAFDDTATTGPDAVFSTIAGTLVSVEWNPAGTGAGKRKLTAEALCLYYHVTAEVKGKVSYEVGFKTDGAMTVGTN